MYWPLERGRIITSPFGQRGDEWHAGTDFGFPGGSAGRKVFSCADGSVLYHGAASGYGGPDPAGWLVILSDNGMVWEYGHIVRLPDIKTGVRVKAGQQIAVINPDTNSNGGTASHLHLSVMSSGYDPNQKIDPLPFLKNALEPPAIMEKDPRRPDFNEYPVWSPNNQDRAGTKIDLFLLHTQEGNGNADSLARYLNQPANAVSYHYTISEDYRDHGVTVCDVVDTDRASWSVLSANNRSINLCFAGSSANWSRAQWMAQSRAIDVAAYLAVQDCRKYGIPIRVLAPPYSSAPPGISDHKYVTQYLKDGTHTDIGPGFPWDYFNQCVNKYANPVAPPVKPSTPAKQYPRDFTDRELLEDLWNKLMKLVSK